MLLYILGFNLVWGVFCFLEKTKITKLVFSERTAFEVTEIWFAVAVVASFLIFAIMPKREKKIENYKCPHCGAEFKGGLKPTFCQVCKAVIEQPLVDKNSKYYKDGLTK